MLGDLSVFICSNFKIPYSKKTKNKKTKTWCQLSGLKFGFSFACALWATTKGIFLLLVMRSQSCSWGQHVGTALPSPRIYVWFLCSHRTQWKGELFDADYFLHCCKWYVLDGRKRVSSVSLCGLSTAEQLCACVCSGSVCEPDGWKNSLLLCKEVWPMVDTSRGTDVR